MTIGSLLVIALVAFGVVVGLRNQRAKSEIALQQPTIQPEGDGSAAARRHHVPLDNSTWKKKVQLAAGGIFKPMIVLTGDSITEYGQQLPHGWALQLAAAYGRRADVVNRGFGGA